MENDDNKGQNQEVIDANQQKGKGEVAIIINENLEGGIYPIRRITSRVIIAVGIKAEVNGAYFKIICSYVPHMGMEVIVEMNIGTILLKLYKIKQNNASSGQLVIMGEIHQNQSNEARNAILKWANAINAEKGNGAKL